MNRKTTENLVKSLKNEDKLDELENFCLNITPQNNDSLPDILKKLQVY